MKDGKRVGKIVSLVLALVLVASLTAACGGSDGGNTGAASGTANASSRADTGNGTVSTAPTVEEIYGEGLSQESVEAMQNSGTIMMYTTDNNLANGKFDKDPYTQKYLEWAKKYYGLTIKYRYRAWSGKMFDSFYVDYAGNDAPDFLSANYYTWPKVGLRNMVYTTEELEKKGVVGLDHPLLKGDSEACERYTIGGKHYAVTSHANVIIIGVNLDLFEKYGVKSPVDYYKEGTWDMDAYVKCSKEITRTLTDGTKIWGGHGWNYNWTLMANDCGLISWDSTRTKLVVTMTDPKVQRACGVIADLYTGRYTPMSDAETYFRHGQMGFYAYIPSNLASVLRKVTFKWDIVPFPYGPDNTTGAYPSELYASCVVSSTKNPQGVINYMISSKIWRDMSLGADFVPETDYYNQVGWGCFTPEQVAMYAAYEDKGAMDLTLGVGNLSSDYGFWNYLRDGRMTYKECVDTYQTVYQNQCDIENEEAAKARKASGS